MSTLRERGEQERESGKVSEIIVVVETIWFFQIISQIEKRKVNLYTLSLSICYPFQYIEKLVTIVGGKVTTIIPSIDDNL